RRGQITSTQFMRTVVSIYKRQEEKEKKKRIKFFHEDFTSNNKMSLIKQNRASICVFPDTKILIFVFSSEPSVLWETNWENDASRKKFLFQSKKKTKNFSFSFSNSFFIYKNS